MIPALHNLCNLICLLITIVSLIAAIGIYKFFSCHSIFLEMLQVPPTQQQILVDILFSPLNKVSIHFQPPHSRHALVESHQDASCNPEVI